MKKYILLMSALSLCFPSFAWVNGNDTNWQTVNSNYNGYKEYINLENYSPTVALKYLSDATSFVNASGMEQDTKILLIGYFAYLMSNEAEKLNLNDEKEQFLELARNSNILTQDNKLDDVQFSILQNSLLAEKSNENLALNTPLNFRTEDIELNIQTVDNKKDDVVIERVNFEYNIRR